VSKARVSSDVIEVWIEEPAHSPTTPTGAGISQDVIEVWIGSMTKARVSQDVVEVWIADSSTPSPPYEPCGDGGGDDAGPRVHTFTS
jgi:hypothetical protein